MDKDRDMREDDALEALFASADATRPAPSGAFMQSLMADAEAAAPRPNDAAPAPAKRARWSVGLKGFFAASGLSGAAVLGLWIGFVMPEVLTPLSTEDTTGLYTFLPGADLTAALSE